MGKFSNHGISTTKKLVVICGPTSSGKSALALKLAKKFDGEIIIADSRQIYRGLNIGTSKPTARERAAVPHHLVDTCALDEDFSVGQYKKLARHAITDIHRRGKLPFLVGGTGLYIDAVTGELSIPAVPPNPTLRATLETRSFAALFSQLRELDPPLAHTIDRHNKRRLIRAIEVCLSTKQRFSDLRKRQPLVFDTLFLAINWPRTELYQRIDQTIDGMLRRGLKQEVITLMKREIHSTRLYALGLEYRFMSEFLIGRLSEGTAIAKLKFASHQYAKRQLNWFRKNKKTHWLKPATAPKEAEALISQFLTAS